MNLIDKTIAAVAPQWGLRRARARLAITAHYDAAKVGRRTSSLRASRADADGAARGRDRMAAFGRDMVRNTPFARRAQSVIAGGVVGDGIIPKVTCTYPDLNEQAVKRIRKRGLQRIEQHLDSCRIDRAGRLNLYGLQHLAMRTIVESGEVLIRLHSGDVPGGLPFQIEVLEPDYLDTGRYGWTADGAEIREGIEFDAAGRRAAYWLFPEHPGADWSPHTRSGVSERVPADEVWHIYLLERPGQDRGVTWFAPVMMRLQDLGDFGDAQLMRQKISACFAAFRIGGDGSKASEFTELAPGLIYDLGDAEEVRFAEPPGVDGYDEFTRNLLRSVAADMGVTYEALTGDLSQVNFSSARMGRLEMDQNISAWQHLMLIPQMMQPLASLFVKAWQSVDGEELADAGLPGDIWDHLDLSWVPPRKIIVDPAREFSALREAVRSGFASRQQVIRQLGIDPERLLEEIAQDRDEADRLQLPFDSDPRADVSRQTSAGIGVEEVIEEMQARARAGQAEGKIRRIR
ncbi:phage portal protein [Paracoccus onubensis]|uniref:phage portal protein n=1 Tax=Paracoccus onubensis TaxID=1675788 RepID=UPI002730C318|nr:phage portal protein [Paracoccus onubensis]MDP0929014.1 phage portal protein [Paracoccus onubensis]